ncbi:MULTISPECIES: TolC family protein [unclassified Moorena]|uniref:TolC family protein n=2 Tax=Moorena TaxID=1155738 RepID=UPI0013BC2031|nr:MULTISPECIES: TolC family protein [unclassified Moorena]NEP66348.1 TolC family protein [Moorena sp. SIO3A5]NER85717.1 TolC family protein [Moorena sp. SIO3A2]NES41424.1 TolC family protein [Moorena sp. SIO2C4]
MPTFRYILAVGVGTAIALSGMESGASEDLPSVTKPQNNSVATPNQESLTEAAPNSEVGELVVEVINNTTSAAKQPEQQESIPSVDSSPSEAELVQEELVQEIIDQTILPTDQPKQEESIPAVAELLAAPTNQPNQEESIPAVAELAAPSESVDVGEDTVVESATEENPELMSQTSGSSPTPGTSAPEFLDPDPNPLSFPTQSQEVQIDITQPITLQQTIELAKRNNQELQQAQLTLERNQFVLQEALTAWYPSLSTSAAINYADSASGQVTDELRAQQGLLPINEPSGSFTAALRLEYNLYTGGQRPAQVRVAEEQLKLQQLEVERLSEEIRLQVTLAYYNLQEADARVEISQAAVTESAQILRDTELLEQAGLGTRFEVLQQQVELANDSQGLTNALSDQRIARRQLAELLNLSQSAEITAADPIEIAGSWDLSLEQSLILSYKNRSELEQQLVQRKINKEQRTIALAPVRPQLSVFGQIDLADSLNDTLGFGDGYSVGAQFQWNFFDGGAAMARARQEDIDVALAESSFANQRDQIRFEIEQAYSQLNSNEESIETASFALEVAQESLRLARLRFQAGVGTQTDVINQQTALTRARINQLTAILGYNRALANLQRAVSNLPDSKVSDIP